MTLDRPSPESVERADLQPERPDARVDEPPTKSDAERDRDFAKARQLVQEHLDENPRTWYGRSSSVEHEESTPGEQVAEKPGDARSDTVRDAKPGPDRWSDPDARQAWVDEWTADPDNTKPVTSTEPWAKYQREHTGDREVKLRTDNPDDTIWADGISHDPETVVAAEAKYVVNSDKSMYEGKAPAKILDVLLSDFDREMRRYGNVVRHEDNPVGCIRLITNTDAAAIFLGDRARRVVGEDVRVDVEVRR
jgi:hypothetical protein